MDAVSRHYDLDFIRKLSTLQVYDVLSTIRVHSAHEKCFMGISSCEYTCESTANEKKHNSENIFYYLRENVDRIQ